MEDINFFNKDYFLLELQTASAIKNLEENDSDSFQLEKVTNVTIGLVLAAKSLKIFDSNIILNWIRKGRKLTPLIEKQFALYDTLSIYLQNNVNIEEDIQEWKQILNNTKYVFPAKDKKGWALIFGDTPIFLEKVNPDELSKSYVVQQQIETSDAEDEDIKQENEVAKIEETSDAEDEDIKKENEVAKIEDTSDSEDEDITQENEVAKIEETSDAEDEDITQENEVAKIEETSDAEDEDIKQENEVAKIEETSDAEDEDITQENEMAKREETSDAEDEDIKQENEVAKIEDTSDAEDEDITQENEVDQGRWQK
ncbi:unnamed protein product [Meganyctiphanes norvegica]|uniref:Uncharacterized protein n=1 Tax=Meganyctiphanes norvegica TaxID=48144 RepID=A0AAV2QA03_MEGNR